MTRIKRIGEGLEARIRLRHGYGATSGEWPWGDHEQEHELAPERVRPTADTITKVAQQRVPIRDIRAIRG
jgi:hypothetical protein